MSSKTPEEVEAARLFEQHEQAWKGRVEKGVALGKPLKWADTTDPFTRNAWRVIALLPVALLALACGSAPSTGGDGVFEVGSAQEPGGPSHVSVSIDDHDYCVDDAPSHAACADAGLLVQRGAFPAECTGTLRDGLLPDEPPNNCVRVDGTGPWCCP